jgi:hypothetical protein
MRMAAHNAFRSVNEMAKKSKSVNQERIAAGDEFASRWLDRLGLASAWRELARAHLEQLCFSDSHDTWPLIESLFTIVPEILNREPERKGLAEAYAWREHDHIANWRTSELDYAME